MALEAERIEKEAQEAQEAAKAKEARNENSKRVRAVTDAFTIKPKDKLKDVEEEDEEESV